MSLSLILAVSSALAAGDPAFTADAGRPFLAYPGDIVELSAEGSTGPDGTQLSVRWAQVDGPLVPLSSTTDQLPRFQAAEPGVHSFDLWVGDGERWSEPDRSYVVVVDRSAGPYSPAGCATGGLPPLGMLSALALLLARRRRTAR
ncbi:MAG: hypothetical protein JXX28_03695 [Deltaproteobacteria bacterium]|nr:hypothetical protein [Deltaproteobacteria bacterium]